MVRANPDSVWVIQAWFGNPRREVRDALDPSHALVVDRPRTLAGQSGLLPCIAADPNDDGRVSIDELLTAVHNSLNQ